MRTVDARASSFEAALGRALRPLEATIGTAWSLGELAQAFLRHEELRHDHDRERVIEDIAARGFYPPIDLEAMALRERADGFLVGKNPHARLSGKHDDRVVAHVHRPLGRPGKELVIVCHCYGLPAPRLMRSLFGLEHDLDADVVSNIMAHHYAGSFRGWPGAGFTSARLSTFIENLRVAVAGLRAITMAMKARHEYERTTVIGFSIGGQLALHLANTGLVDQALVYCPAVSMHKSATELGLMGALHRPVRSLLARTGSSFSFDALQLTEPLRYPLAIEQRDLHVVAQRYDALAPPSQVGLIREAYPNVSFHELNGTHLYPAGRQRLRAIVAELLR